MSLESLTAEYTRRTAVMGWAHIGQGEPALIRAAQSRQTHLVVERREGGEEV